MHDTRDKRHRADLDLFVLALIDSGLSNAYQFQREAGLSQGATLSVLQRLIDARLVTQEQPGVRGRIDYRIAPGGTKLLKKSCKALIQGRPGSDIDSNLRVALLALWADGDRGQIVEFLRRSAEQKADLITGVGQVSDSLDGVPLARWYSQLRSASAKALLVAESEALRVMADSLPKDLPRRPKRSRT